jgi:hypothetical protein
LRIDGIFGYRDVAGFLGIILQDGSRKTQLTRFSVYNTYGDNPNNRDQRDHSMNASLDVRTEAEKIISNALERYRKPDGYEGYLVDAAWQLEQIGSEAMSALEALMHSRAPECEFFLGAVVRMRGVTKQQRLTALVEAAKHPDTNVRSRLMELIDEMPNDMRVAILEEFQEQVRIDGNE